MDMNLVEHYAALVHAVVPTPESAANTVYRYIVAFHQVGDPVTQTLLSQVTGLSRSTISRQANRLARLNRITIRRQGRTTFLLPKEEA